jgi:hypothetical protein
MKSRFTNRFPDCSSLCSPVKTGYGRNTGEVRTLRKFRFARVAAGGVRREKVRPDVSASGLLGVEDDGFVQYGYGLRKKCP